MPLVGGFAVQTPCIQRACPVSVASFAFMVPTAGGMTFTARDSNSAVRTSDGDRVSDTALDDRGVGQCHRLIDVGAGAHILSKLISVLVVGEC